MAAVGASVASGQPDSLDRLLFELRDDGFGIGVGEFAQVRLVLARLRQQGKDLRDPEVWGPWIAPIVCSSASQQEAFYRRLKKLGPEPGKPPVVTRDPLREQLTEQANREAEKTVKETTWYRRYRSLVWAGLAIVLGISAWFFVEPPEPAPDMSPLPGPGPYISLVGPRTVEHTLGEPFRDPGGIALDSMGKTLPLESACFVDVDVAGTYRCAYTATDDDGNVGVVVRTVTVVDPDTLIAEVEPDVLAIIERSVAVSLPWLAAFLLLSTIIGRRRTLERQFGLRRPDAELIRFTTRASMAFSSARIRRQLRGFRLHQRRPSRRMDVPQSVKATLRNAGIPTLVMRERALTPEYIVISPRGGTGDHREDMVRQLVAALSDEQVPVRRYHYVADPRRLCDSTAANGGYETLGEVLSQHGDHRLLLVDDGSSIINPRTGQPRRFAQDLLSMPLAILLTPVPVAQWGARERTLERAGFWVLPLQGEGIDELADLLRQGVEVNAGAVPDVPAEEGSRLPALIAAQAETWLAPVEPPAAEQERLLGALESYLDAQAMEWLAALAVFPQIHPELTRHLGASLLDLRGEALLNDARLLRMAQLPWLREGYMPDWLRRRLLDNLPVAREQAVRDALTEVLLSSTHDRYGFDLEIVPKRGRDRVAALLAAVRGLGLKSEFREQLFLDFLRGEHRLAVSVPQALARRLVRQQWLPVGGIAIAAALSAYLWDMYPEAGFISLLLEQPWVESLLRAARDGRPVLAGISGGLSLLAVLHWVVGIRRGNTAPGSRYMDGMLMVLAPVMAVIGLLLFSRYPYTGHWLYPVVGAPFLVLLLRLQDAPPRKAEYAVDRLLKPGTSLFATGVAWFIGLLVIFAEVMRRRFGDGFNRGEDQFGSIWWLEQAPDDVFLRDWTWMAGDLLSAATWVLVAVLLLRALPTRVGIRKPDVLLIGLRIGLIALCLRWVMVATMEPFFTYEDRVDGPLGQAQAGEEFALTRLAQAKVAPRRTAPEPPVQQSTDQETAQQEEEGDRQVEEPANTEAEEQPSRAIIFDDVPAAIGTNTGAGQDVGQDPDDTPDYGQQQEEEPIPDEDPTAQGTLPGLVTYLEPAAPYVYMLMRFGLVGLLLPGLVLWALAPTLDGRGMARANDARGLARWLMVLSLLGLPVLAMAYPEWAAPSDAQLASSFLLVATLPPWALVIMAGALIGYVQTRRRGFFHGLFAFALVTGVGGPMSLVGFPFATGDLGAVLTHYVLSWGPAAVFAIATVWLLKRAVSAMPAGEARFGVGPVSVLDIVTEGRLAATGHVQPYLFIPVMWLLSVRFSAAGLGVSLVYFILPLAIWLGMRYRISGLRAVIVGVLPLLLSFTAVGALSPRDVVTIGQASGLGYVAFMICMACARPERVVEWFQEPLGRGYIYGALFFGALVVQQRLEGDLGWGWYGYGVMELAAFIMGIRGMAARRIVRITLTAVAILFVTGIITSRVFDGEIQLYLGAQPQAVLSMLCWALAGGVTRSLLDGQPDALYLSRLRSLWGWRPFAVVLALSIVALNSLYVLVPPRIYIGVLGSHMLALAIATVAGLVWGRRAVTLVIATMLGLVVAEVAIGIALTGSIIGFAPSNDDGVGLVGELPVISVLLAVIIPAFLLGRLADRLRQASEASLKAEASMRKFAPEEMSGAS